MSFDWKEMNDLTDRLLLELFVFSEESISAEIDRLAGAKARALLNTPERLAK